MFFHNEGWIKLIILVQINITWPKVQLSKKKKFNLAQMAKCDLNVCS